MRNVIKWIVCAIAIMGLVVVIGFVLFLNSPMFYWYKGDIRQHERRNEKLPTVTINGDIVYCRMSACDFRFPLPEASRVVNTELTEGGFDTVNGFVYVAATNALPIDLDAYSKKLGSYYHVEEGGLVTAEPTGTNNIVQIKFSYFGDY